jgi:hypothetical protein
MRLSGETKGAPWYERSAVARSDAAAGLRVPAAEIEQIVVNRIRRLLAERASLFEILEAQARAPLLQQKVIQTR